MTDKEGRRLKGPPIDRERKMTLQEYQKVAAQFEVMSEERLSRYGSAKKMPEQAASPLDFISEHEELAGREARRRSPEKIVSLPGAEAVFDREVNMAQHKLDLKAKRKDLRSANVKTLNEKVLAHHNKEVRLTSAKQQQDVRVRPASKLTLKGRVFNYGDNADLHSDLHPSSIALGRPQSGHPSTLLLNKQSRLHHQNKAASLIDEFNKKLVEKGTSYPVLPSELPQISKYLQKKQERPQTSKPPVVHGPDQGAVSLATKTQLLRKGPRERMISAKQASSQGFLLLK